MLKRLLSQPSALITLALGCTVVLVALMGTDGGIEQFGFDLKASMGELSSGIEAPGKELRDRIKEYCRQHLSDDRIKKVTFKSNSHWRGNLWYSKEIGLTWCPIPKAATTSIYQHIKNLTETHFPGAGMNRKTIMHEKFFSVLDTTSLTAVGAGSDGDSISNSGFTFTFVRHPFSRLVSGFTERVEKDWSLQENQQFKAFRNQLLEEYEGMNKDSPTFYNATPSSLSFTLYIMDRIQEAPSSIPRLDNNFKPQWASCPFCLVGFDFVGKIERFERDMGYVMERLNMEDPFVFNPQKLNPPSESAESREKRFFSKLPAQIIRRLYEMFRPDFEMFGYGKIEDGAIDKYIGWGMK